MGEIGVMAREQKNRISRLAAITQPFTYGYFLVQKGSGLGNLQQGETIASLRGIKEDIFLTAYGSYIIELTDRCTDDKKINLYLFRITLSIVKLFK